MAPVVPQGPRSDSPVVDNRVRGRGVPPHRRGRAVEDSAVAGGTTSRASDDAMTRSHRIRPRTPLARPGIRPRGAATRPHAGRRLCEQPIRRT